MGPKKLITELSPENELDIRPYAPLESMATAVTTDGAAPAPAPAAEPAPQPAPSAQTGAAKPAAYPPKADGAAADAAGHSKPFGFGSLRMPKWFGGGDKVAEPQAAAPPPPQAQAKPEEPKKEEPKKEEPKKEAAAATDLPPGASPLTTLQGRTTS